jgi:hypothetical protein
MTDLIAKANATSQARSVRPWQFVALLPLLLLLTSCSTTRTLSYANDQETSSAPISSIVTVMVDERSYLRAAVENNLTGRLKKRGLEAHSSYRKVGLKELEGDTEKARQALSIWGAEAVLVCRLTDRTDVSRPPEFVSATSHWEETWAAPDTRSAIEPSPWGGELTVTIRLESKLYRLSDAELLWVGYTETKVKEFTDDLKRIESVTSHLVKRLAKDGLIK